MNATERDREKLNALADRVCDRLDLDDEAAEQGVQISYPHRQICIRADLLERLLDEEGTGA